VDKYRYVVPVRVGVLELERTEKEKSVDAPPLRSDGCEENGEVGFEPN
jgi:hypothetical protein